MISNSNTAEQEPPKQRRGVKTAQQRQELLNRDCLTSLPPNVEGSVQGRLFIELGQVEWLIYNERNYLQTQQGAQMPLKNVFVNIKFYGDQSKGLFLRPSNVMGPKEKMTNKFAYEVKCPEKVFERYLDDMGSIRCDFFDTELNQTIGTSMIIPKMYLKRERYNGDQFPMLELRESLEIQSIGNQNLKIGKFSISITTNFGEGAQPKREKISLDDSFEANEKLAEQEANSRILEKSFPDNRIPASYQRTQADYQTDKYQNDLDERPIRQPANPQKQHDNKENKRNMINIDEADDTIQTNDDMMRLLARAKNLEANMGAAIEPTQPKAAWESLHGVHESPKKYVPPFLRGSSPEKQAEQDLKDELYDFEIGSQYKNEKSPSEKGRDDLGRIQDTLNMKMQQQENLNLQDMRYIKIRIGQMKVDDEDFLDKIRDNTFTLTVNLPLPDIYQKEIAFQTQKLNNYDWSGRDTCDFNHLSLYNFKLSEPTLERLTQSKLEIGIDALKIKGYLSMNKLILAKNFSFGYELNLEQTVQISNMPRNASKIGKGSKKADTQVSEIQTIQKKVGTITVDLNLQAGDTEEELQKAYQIKMLQMEEHRQKQEQEKLAKDRDRMSRYMTEREPVFAQLYLSIDKIEGVAPRPQSLIQTLSQHKAFAFDTFNQRNVTLPADTQQPVQIGQDGTQQVVEEGQKEEEKPVVLPERNLYVQYKAFPSMEVLKSEVVYNQKEPRFRHKSQFPVMMVPDTLEKLENFCFMLEIWDEVSPTMQSEFLGLVKIPLRSFCISMKTTEDQVFSLNFLADQHCIYPMIINDQALPIWSPREGKDIGSLKVTLAMGSPLQINRQIQKQQERDIQEEKELREREQRELELRLEKERRMEAEEQLRLRAEEAERLANMKQPEKPRTPIKVGLSQEDLMNSINGFFRKSIQKKDLDTSKNTYLDCLRKLFEESRRQKMQTLEFLSQIALLEGDLIKKDEFVFTLMNRDGFSLTRSEINSIFSLFQKEEKEVASSSQIEKSYQQYLKYNQVTEKRVIETLELLEVCLRKALTKEGEVDQTEWLQLVNQIEEKVSESKILLSDLKRVLEDNGVVVGPGLYDQLSAYFDLERDDKLYASSILEYLGNPSVQQFNYFRICPRVLEQQCQEFIKNCILEVGIDKIEREISEALTKLHPEIDALLNSHAGPVPPLDFKEVESSPSKNLGSSQRMRHKRKKEQEERAEQEAKLAAERAQREKEEQELRIKKLGGVLLKENVTYSIFQKVIESKCGNLLSSWEVFTFFEMLNTTYGKMFYEPKRCQEVSWSLIFKAITNQDFKESLGQRSLMKASVDSGLALALNLNEGPAQALQAPGGQLTSGKEQSPCGRHSKRRGKRKSEDSSGIYSSKSNLSQGDDEDSEEEEVAQASPRVQNRTEEKRPPTKRSEKPQVDQMSFQHQQPGGIRSNATLGIPEEGREHNAVKHIFEVKVQELKQIAILNQIIQNQSLYEDGKIPLTKGTSPTKKAEKRALKESQKYIHNVAVKYAFPLDDDETHESDYLQLCKDRVEQNKSFDYSVSMETTHIYTLSKKDSIVGYLQNHMKQADQDTFALRIVRYDNGKEFVVGNAALPLEDIVQLCEEAQNESFAPIMNQKKCQRTLLVYGTQFCGREAMLIGKMVVSINYQTVREYFLQNQGESQLDISQTMFSQANQQCFLHRETYINRKIPLNANLSIHIDQVKGLKDSIQNIEHFSKIYQLSDSAIEEGCPSVHFDRNNHVEAGSHSGAYSYTGMITNRKEAAARGKEQAEKRRITTQILRDGLNLAVFSSVFEQDDGLKEKLGGNQRTRLIYNTLGPVFNEGFNFNVQMDQRVFEYLKNKKAVFEIRHYISKEKKDQLSFDQSKIEGSHVNKSMPSEDEEDLFMEESEHIVIGKVRVPLINLITKNSGIHGEFIIHDEWHQQMGSLTLRLSLNHHNTQRPLYSQDNRIHQTQQLNDRETVGTVLGKTATLLEKTQTIQNMQINDNGRSLRGLDSSKFVIALNFVELILQDRKKMQKGHFYLDYRFLGQNKRTKFLQSQRTSRNQEALDLESKMKLKIIDINRVQFLQVDLSDRMEAEQAFNKPLEIQLWYQEPSENSYQKASNQVKLGSFIVELNDLGKVHNPKVKSHSQEFFASEGYFTLLDLNQDKITQDRLGLKLFMLKQIEGQANFDQQVQDMEVLFHNLSGVRAQVENKFDKDLKGVVALDVLEEIVSQNLQGVHQDLMMRLISNMEYKKEDKIFYSPLFGEIGPFFKFANRFDQQGVIAKFFKEFSQIDQEEDGLVPVNLFRSILEQELSVKEKIVDDFIFQSKPEHKGNRTFQAYSLDVNLTTNAATRQSLDYIVLVRKLLKFFEKSLGENLRTQSEGHLEFDGQEANMTSSFRQRPGSTFTAEPQITEVKVNLGIESAMRLKHPLNDMIELNPFVTLQWPYDKKQAPIETQVMNRTNYPSWYFKEQGLKLRLTKENVSLIASQPLEFQIRHKTLSREQLTDEVIGVASVDLSSLLYVEGKKEISGYFHIFTQQDLPQTRDYETQTLLHEEAKRKSLGEVKISLEFDIELKRVANSFQKETVDRLSPLRQSVRSSTENPFRQSLGKGIGYGDSFGKANQDLSNTLQSYVSRIQPAEEDNQHLKAQLSSHLSVLDQMTMRMKQSLQDGPINKAQEVEEDFERSAPSVNPDFSLTQGARSDLRNQLQPLQEELANRNVQERMEHKYADPNTIVQEEEEGGSEFGRSPEKVEEEVKEEEEPVQREQVKEEEQPVNVFDQQHQAEDDELEMDLETQERIARIMQNK